MRSTTRWLSHRKLSLAQGYHFVVCFHQTGGGSLNRASSFHFGGLAISWLSVLMNYYLNPPNCVTIAWT